MFYSHKSPRLEQVSLRGGVCAILQGCRLIEVLTTWVCGFQGHLELKFLELHSGDGQVVDIDSTNNH